jgi:hypothetical protein
VRITARERENAFTYLLSFDVDQKKEKREGVKLAALLWLQKIGQVEPGSCDKIRKGGSSLPYY